jgi:hypothetical protein
VDERTFRQLKESKYYYPVLTEVMFDYNMMLEMVYHSMTIIQKGYDTVWDSGMLYFLRTYFEEGIKFIEKLVIEKGIKIRLIIEATKQNIEYVNEMSLFDIRYLDDIKGNFGIFDNRAYMVYIFHRHSDKPDQTLWSNSKTLVEKLQILFDKLWSMAKPISVRKKEIEYDEIKGIHKAITNYQKILDEIQSLFLTSNHELTIFASTKILCSVLNRNNLVKYLPTLLERNLTVKILTDSKDDYLIKQVNSLDTLNPKNPIQLGYSNKIGELNEMTIISDDKRLLNTRYDRNNKLIATFSSEESSILVQELMFEKHWNEVKNMEINNH